MDSEIVRDQEVAGEVLAAFGRVQRFALGEAGVFGMPEHEVLHAELRCRVAGFTNRAVVLFVGLEAVAVRA